MKTPFLKQCLLLLSCCIFQSVAAQYFTNLLPRSSPDREIMQRIAYTEVSVTYGSPRALGREIWGNLVPYEQIWRSGANEATKVHFSREVTIGGSTLAAGTYGLFIEARQNQSWKIHFNSKAEQWGAFRFDPALDVLVVEALPNRQNFQESLTYTLDQVGLNHGLLGFGWGEWGFDLPFEVGFVSALQAQVDSSVATVDITRQWLAYLQAAEVLVKQKDQLELAQTWLDESLERYPANAEWSSNYYPKVYILGHLHWTRALAAAAQGNINQAVQEAESMIALEGRYTYYKRKAEVENIDALLASWKEQLE